MMANYRERAAYEWTDDSIRIITTTSLMAKKTFFYVQEIGSFRTKIGYFTEREHLPSYLIVFTKSGKGILKYKNKTYELLPNKLFFIDCMNYHFYETDQNELWEMLWVHFNGPMCPGYYQFFNKHESPVLNINSNSPIPSILAQLLEINQNQDVRTEPISSKLLNDLLTELILTKETMETSEFFLPEYLKQIMNHFEKRFNEKITLDDLAKQFSINKYHLIKEFKKYTGTSPNDFLINCRISNAKKLLQYSEIAISEISFASGIENVSHFINLFKNREGMTPLAFRKKWKSIKQT